MLKKLFCRSKERGLDIFPVFYLLFYILHHFMRLISDDVHQKEVYVFDSFLQRISWIYTRGAGKILTDSFGGVLTTIPFFLWKILDAALWCAMIYLFGMILFTLRQEEKAKRNYFLFSGLMLFCYPYQYLPSAGYIMTSSNYIYPSFCILLCMYLLLRSPFRGKLSFACLTPAVICAAYAGSQEQSACVLLGLLLGFLFLKLYRKEPYSKMLIAAEFFACAAVFLIVMTSPGLNARTVETTIFHVPNYDTWSFSTKIFKGYTTTAAVVLFCPCMLYYLFVFLLLLCGLRKSSPLQRILSSLPFLESLVIFIIGSEYFVEYPDYGHGMPDIRVLYHGNETMFFVFLSVLIVISVILAILSSQDSFEKALILLFLAAVAFSSRVAMGFSPTLFGSSFRTFTYLLFLLMAACLLLIRELDNSKRMYLPVFCTFAVVLAVITYAAGFQSVVFI